jgi:hypothetical protein
MADGGTPIGALAVRIGGDATDLIKAFAAGGKSSKAFKAEIDQVKSALTTLTAALAPAAFAAWISKMADAADQAGKTAQKVGMSVESFSELSYAAKSANVSAEQLTTGLKQLSKFMVENNVAGVSVEEQLLKIADEFANARDDANKTAVAMQYFGKSGADLIPFLNQGRAGIEELRKEAQRLGIVVSKEAAEAAAKFNDNLTTLKAGAEGAGMAIGGPLIKALADATSKFIEARKEGEGFWEAMKRGLGEFLIGSDLHNWNKEFTKATENLQIAQNQLDRVKAAAASPNGQLFSEQSAAAVAKYTENLKKAQEEVNRLQRIKPVLAPDAPPKPGPTSSVTAPIDPAKAARDAELVARQAEEAAEHEIKLRTEVADIQQQLRNRELEAERAARAMGLDEGHSFSVAEIEQMKARYDERNQILMEAYDREQALAIENGQAILDAERDALRQRLELGYTHQELSMGAAKTFFGSMSMLMNTHSKKMFEIGKVGAIAETVINTHSAAMAAYRALAGIPIVGPALGAAAAGAVVLYGASQIRAIRSQSFGGGGSPSVGTHAASPTTGQPVGTPGGDVGGGGGRDRGPDTFISLSGDSHSNKSVRALLKRLEAATKDGGRVFVVEPS